MNRIYELTPSPEESVIPRILLLVHQAVDEHFPAAEKAGRQFSKTVFSDELTEKTAGDRPAPPDDGFTIPTPPSSGISKASTSAVGSDNHGHTAPPAIPPPPPAKSVEKKESTSPSSTQTQSPPAAGPSDHPISFEERIPASFSPEEEGQDEPLSGAGKNKRGKESRDKDSHEQRREKKPHQDVGSSSPDWTTRITLALLLAGILLLGYVVLV